MFFRRSLPVFLCLLFLALPAAAFAQTSPSVIVEFASQQAAVGETVSANVVIRNGANIAGADIGVETGDCLRIVGKTQGAYLPDASSGGFTVFDQTTDHSARLAVAITDRAAIANADGVFFQLEMEVVCSDDSAAVDVSVAELSAYADPTAEQIELLAYTKDAGSLTAASTQVALSAPTGTATASQDSAETTETTSASAASPIGADTDDAQPGANETTADAAVIGSQAESANGTQAIESTMAESAPATANSAATDGPVTQLPPVGGVAQESAESTTLALLAAIVIVTAIVAAATAILIYRIVAARR